MTDIDIAKRYKIKNIYNIAKKININKNDLSLYGNYKAKILQKPLTPKGKLVLVTAISPTPLGEGKTTTAIGLADGLNKLKRQSVLALREPSLGPVFGIKGGACGGGKAQVTPMIDINLHFNGDFHAITSANNLLCSLVDNHMTHGNKLKIDPEKIHISRCVDLNDRALREITIGQGSSINGIERKDKFTITAASELMAVLCLATGVENLRERLSNIIVATSKDNKDIKAKDLNAVDSMLILLKDAISPNLVQTLEGTPAIIHGGPFANIAHGCNSVIATKTALGLADIVVTEAGFGSDLGCEKFINIKCPLIDKYPDAIVLVCTLRALRYNGGADREKAQKNNIKALMRGVCNLEAHINNLKNKFNGNVVVSLNKFKNDNKKEIDVIRDICSRMGVRFAINTSWARGSKGAIDLATEVIKALEDKNEVKAIYIENDTLQDKIEKIAKNIYSAKNVEYSPIAKEKIEYFQDKYPEYNVCIAKTQYSFSDSPFELGAAKDHTIHVDDVQIRGGAKFIVVIAGRMNLMPGLPENPAACNMSIDNSLEIRGLS